jgi:hypothetical protein
MFLVTEADADAIRAIFNQEGELSAAIESCAGDFLRSPTMRRRGRTFGRSPDGSRHRLNHAP